MDNIDLGAPLKETIEGLRKYIDQLLGYNKLILTKKMGELSSYLTLYIALGFLSTLALVFLSFGFVWWYSGENAGERYIGFLIVAGFYILIALLLFIFRERIIFKPMRKALGNILYRDADSGQDREIFNSSEMLDSKIKNAKEALSSQEKELNELVEDLEHKYTFVNISKHLFQNAYKSFVTTSNVMKLAFTFMQKIQKRKARRSIKKENKQLKDQN